MFWFRKRSRSTKSRLPLTRFIGPGATIAGLLALLGFGVTKGVDFSKLDSGVAQVKSQLEAPRPAPAVLTSNKPTDRIRIASFNIQVFGDKKASDNNVMGVLANICSHFDVVAIQEIKTPDARSLDRLVERINAGGGRYAGIVSPSLGRTSQTEQYGFIWDTTRIRNVPNTTYVVNDAEDRMHREPMASTFETAVPPASGRDGFKFTLINVHTDPDEVKTKGPDNELNVLDDVYLSIREFEYARQGEDDIFLLGDLNSGYGKLFELGAIPGLESVTGDQPTNTVGNKQHDHFLVDRSTTTEFTGAAGVIDFVADFGLTLEQAKLVSDHRPIWAEFSAYEQPAFTAVAARPTGNGR